MILLLLDIYTLVLPRDGGFGVCGSTNNLHQPQYPSGAADDVIDPQSGVRTSRDPRWKEEE